MPRRARLVIPGIPWHIVQRGNNRSACFYDHCDYQYYLDTLANQAIKHECQIHAWCLMSNHVHLLITPAQADSASLVMKHLGQSYVQYINRSYQRSGTLWEGRFRSCLVQDDHYALACYRYIEMNPVRAGMVAHPAEYRWSSYRANAQGEEIDWLTPQAEYLALGRDKAARRINYRRLFKAKPAPGVIDEIRTSTNGNYALGNEQFRTEVTRKLKTRATPGTPGRPSGTRR